VATQSSKPSAANKMLSTDEASFWIPLVEISADLVRVIDKQTKSKMQVHTNFAEAALLAYLAGVFESGMSMTELSQKLNLSASRVTRIIQDMESKGLVIRNQSKLDKRSNIVRITKVGVARLNEDGPVHINTVREVVFSKLNEAEMKMLAKLLVRIRQSLAEVDHNLT
jgi:DNA-binding MarR family transcriptional regulator